MKFQIQSFPIGFIVHHHFFISLLISELLTGNQKTAPLETVGYRFSRRENGHLKYPYQTDYEDEGKSDEKADRKVHR